MKIVPNGIKPAMNETYLIFKNQGFGGMYVGSTLILQGNFIFFLFIAKKLPNNVKGLDTQIHKIINNKISLSFNPIVEFSKLNNIRTKNKITILIPGNKMQLIKVFFSQFFPPLFLYTKLLT
jgi:hypothetical protein